MIIDFTITNFRSIRTEQTFSLFAENPGSHLLENIFYQDNDKVGVLKCAGIYGANASGKSNLLLAIDTLQSIICNSDRLKEGDDIPAYEPYLLADDTKTAPTKFEVEFYTPDNTRYKYVISFDSKKIIEEHLDFYPSAKPASIFSRNENDSWRDIKFGVFYKGGKKRHPFFENNAYISIAGSRADTPELVRNVYNYFRRAITFLKNDLGIQLLGMPNEDNLLNKISSLLSFADTGISGIKIEERKNPQKINFPDDMPKDIKDMLLNHNKIKYRFAHETDIKTKEYFDLENESAGTQKLFGIAPIIIKALKNGEVLIIDELDNSMHPFVEELIIKLFNDEDINTKGAQLIFSTHNINLMSPELLRRDQIWLVEKNEGATTIYSLDSFDKEKVKPSSPFHKWYGESRLGGVPLIDYKNITKLLKPSSEANAEE